MLSLSAIHSTTGSSFFFFAITPSSILIAEGEYINGSQILLRMDKTYSWKIKYLPSFFVFFFQSGGRCGVM